jgi:hypothetical protein
MKMAVTMRRLIEQIELALEVPRDEQLAAIAFCLRDHPLNVQRMALVEVSRSCRDAGRTEPVLMQAYLGTMLSLADVQEAMQIARTDAGRMKLNGGMVH